CESWRFLRKPFLHIMHLRVQQPRANSSPARVAEDSKAGRDRQEMAGRVLAEQSPRNYGTLRLLASARTLDPRSTNFAPSQAVRWQLSCRSTRPSPFASTASAFSNCLP